MSSKVADERPVVVVAWVRFDDEGRVIGAYHDLNEMFPGSADVIRKCRIQVLEEPPRGVAP